jgi:hypothetical protein
LSSVLSRLGGILVHPAKTLFSILSGKGGSLFEVIACALVVAAAISPARAGQCFLMARVDVFEGLRRVPNLLSNQLGPPMLTAMVAALILTLLGRSLRRSADEERIGSDWTFDRCLDACFYMLIPFLVMASVGVILEQLGVRWWFLPHRPFRGSGGYLLARIAIAFGWSISLYLMLLKRLWTGKPPEESPGVES